MTDALIIIAKNPQLGKTKTRIGKKAGDQIALAVYNRLIRYTQEITKEVEAHRIVYYSDFIDTEDSWDNKLYSKQKQVDASLGERMSSALNDTLQKGYYKAVLIGTDIYELTTDIINSAFKMLDNADVVLGPAKDGGYYLIGMKKPHLEIFEISEWSTDKVLSETLELVKKEGLGYQLLTPLNDIDEPEDLLGTDLSHLLES